MTELDLLVVGDINPDVIVAGADLEPKFGQVEQLVDRGTLVMGGSAAITACGAVRLGCSVGLCGVLGIDALGEFMTRELTTAGVDLDMVRQGDEQPTGLSVILDHGDDRAILTSRGSISALTPNDLAAFADRPARHVHVSSYYLMSQAFREALPRALKRWQTAGVTTSIDTNWDPSGEWNLTEVLAQIDVFLPNHAELMAITGAEATGAALREATTHARSVVVKRGDAGAIAMVGGDRFTVAAAPPPFFGDAIGAGDSFDAGYLAGMVTGAGVEASLRLAVAAGTLSTRGVGGTQAQPHRAEAEAWGAELVLTGPHHEAGS